MKQAGQSHDSPAPNYEKNSVIVFVAFVSANINLSFQVSKSFAEK